MFAALYLATEPGARHGFEVFGRRGLLQPVEDFQCLRVMAEMGLAAVDFDGETLRLRPLPTSGKVDLGASKLLQALRERRQSLL